MSPDLFNNKAFQVVQNDLSTKNAVSTHPTSTVSAATTSTCSNPFSILPARQKVRERRKLYPETSVTLEDILRNEKESGELFCTGQLTWLLRSVSESSLYGVVQALWDMYSNTLDSVRDTVACGSPVSV
jgi:hypothetical protein